MRLIGIWSLVSIHDKLPDGRIVDHPDFGAGPAGRLIYTASGHMSVQFMREDRPGWSSEHEPAGTERAAAAAGYGAYAGRFTVNEKEKYVLHHVEVALIPNRVGRDLKRFYSFSGDQLTLRPPIFVTRGVAIERALTWKKLADS
jgi:lipocalin-like protein